MRAAVGGNAQHRCGSACERISTQTVLRSPYDDEYTKTSVLALVPVVETGVVTCGEIRSLHESLDVERLCQSWYSYCINFDPEPCADAKRHIGQEQYKRNCVGKSMVSDLSTRSLIFRLFSFTPCSVGSTLQFRPRDYNARSPMTFQRGGLLRFAANG